MNEAKWGKLVLLGACLGAVLIPIGCERTLPSPIVEKVEKAGAGDLAIASVGSIREWLERHPGLAIQVQMLCVPAREKGSVKWPETTEGRVCSAAAQVAGFIEWQRKIQTNNDHKTFEGGSK
jgi:hypothetical protein